MSATLTRRCEAPAADARACGSALERTTAGTADCSAGIGIWSIVGRKGAAAESDAAEAAVNAEGETRGETEEVDDAFALLGVMEGAEGGGVRASSSQTSM
ncbi:MAG: hypothetical protein U1F25_07160 [Rubrivivax sp.]